jgi:hypothetical protein
LHRRPTVECLEDRLVPSAYINFDDVPSGTAIGTHYQSAGVKLSDWHNTGTIEAIADNVAIPNGNGGWQTVNVAASPPNVLGDTAFGGGTIFSANFIDSANIAKVQFANPQQVVSIDALPILPPEYLTTPQNKPYLQPYDTSGNAMTLPVLYPLNYGDPGWNSNSATWQTITFISTSANIGSVKLSSQINDPNVSVAGEFDNLHFGLLTDTWALRLSGPTAVTAGQAFNITVTAVDINGNITPKYTGTVHFAGGGNNATLPADYTFTATDAGKHTFTVTLRTAGPQTLTVDDKGSTASPGQVSLTVNPAPASTLSMSAGLPFAVAGQAHWFQLTALDPFGNVATRYRDTVHFTSSDLQAILPPPHTFTSTDAGVYGFTATLKTAGIQSVKAADTLTPTITGKASVTVLPAAATHFSVTSPASVTAGIPFNVTVTAQDAFGNTATNYFGNVQLTSSDAKAGLPADYMFGSSDKGVHTFKNVVLVTAGSQTITATDVTKSISGKETVSVNIVAGVAVGFVLAGSPTADVGTPYSFTVTAVDAYGKVATGYRGTVHFSSSDRYAQLPGSYTFTATDAGSHSFGVVFRTTGIQSLSVVDNIGLTGVDPAIAVSTAAGTGVGVAFILTGLPPSVTVGLSYSFTVTAVDANGNVVTGYRGTVHFSSSDRYAMLPGRYTFTATDAGTHTFNIVFTTPGTQSLLVVDDLGLVGVDAIMVI